MTYVAALVASIALFALIAREEKHVGTARVVSFTSTVAALGVAAHVKGVIRGYPAPESTALMMAVAYAGTIIVTLGRPGLLIFEADRSLDRSQLSARGRQIVRRSPWLIITALLLCALPFFEF
ncbi:hypothetical protein [uncultured Cellulomonas sp.]|uniref:hypothetical protein n=1 Tax=uncultured Cellulomonas sp. TaxID=189682 RepID=UPI0026392DB5|nr:hypothetical protein [uncultured Cellulomonas sp.]